MRVLGQIGRRRHESRPLRQFETLRDCPSSQLAALGRLSAHMTVPAGTVVCREDAVGREAFLVLAGQASVTSGDRQVTVVGPGSVLGEMALLDGQPRTATVTATSPLEVLVFTAGEFERMLRSAPWLVRRMSAALSGRLREIEEVRAG